MDGWGCGVGVESVDTMKALSRRIYGVERVSVINTEQLSIFTRINAIYYQDLTSCEITSFPSVHQHRDMHTFRQDNTQRTQHVLQHSI